MTSTDIVSPNARFTHFGFWVTDIERMADFYQKLFKIDILLSQFVWRKIS